MYAIEVKNIRKSYQLYTNEKDVLKELITGKQRHRKFEALKGISFKVVKGENFGILGGNGSGKSTILNIINGTTQPTSGSIKAHGKIALLNVGAGIIPNYTGYENIYYKCGLMGLKKAEIEEKMESIIEFSEIRDFLDQPVNKYSAGMRSKLGFAIAIHCAPEILIVDEALAVGDSRFQAKCHNMINKLQDEGMTIILVSHSHGQVKQICKNAIWIQNGELICQGKSGPVADLYESYMANKITIEEARKLVRESDELV